MAKRYPNKLGGPKRLALRDFRCFNIVKQKIKDGVALEEIVRWIQTEAREGEHLSRHQLLQELKEVRNSIPYRQLQMAPPPYMVKTIEKMSRNIDELRELENLYLLQVQRISRDAETEEKINKLFSGTYKEIDLAKDILATMAKIKMEMGILTKDPLKVEITGGLNIGQPALDPQTQAKLGLAAEKLVQALAATTTGEVIDVEARTLEAPEERTEA
jgi:hypothetical protein